MTDDRTITTESTSNGSAPETNGDGKLGYALTGLEVEGFRGLNKLKLERLGRVNLFVGKNNCGKTSVLEAVALALDPFDTGFTEIFSNGRKFTYYVNTSATPVLNPSIEWLFYFNKVRSSHFFLRLTTEKTYDLKFGQESYKVSKSEHVKASVENGANPGDAIIGKNYNIILHRHRFFLEVPSEIEPYVIFDGFIGYEPSPGESLPANFIPTERLFYRDRKSVILPHLRPIFIEFTGRNAFEGEILNRFSEIKLHLTGFFDSIIMPVIRSFDGEIEDIEILNQKGPMLHLRHATRGYLPLGTFGDGMKKSLSLLLALASVPNGALLIDEFEVGMHYSVLEEVLTVLIIAAQKFNVQLYLTTHSLEAIDTLIAACKKADEHDFITYLLTPTPTEIDVQRWDLETLGTMRYDLGMEIR